MRITKISAVNEGVIVKKSFLRIALFGFCLTASAGTQTVKAFDGPIPPQCGPQGCSGGAGGPGSVWLGELQR